MSFIPTKCAALKKDAANNFKCVTFEYHKSQKSRKIADSDKTSLEENIKSRELNMKQAKYEIIKFGMSGFDPKKKEEAKVQLAIKLGNVCYNTNKTNCDYFRCV